MPRPFRVSRVLAAMAIMASVVASLMTMPAAAAREGNSSIEVHNRLCPTEYAGENFFEDCHATSADPGHPFTFSNGVTQDGTTDEAGDVGFANLPAGTYTVTGGVPDEFVEPEPVVYCAVGTEADPNQEQIPVTDVTGGVQFDLPEGTNVICDWYEIPYDLQGDSGATATPDPQPNGSSIEVHARTCPEGYAGETFFQDCHDTVPDPGFPFTFADGVTQDGTTNENGNVGFANLPAGTYAITGGAPGEFTDLAVYCAIGTEADPNQEQIPVDDVTGGVQLDLPEDTNVICDWYIIPQGQQGDQTPTATAAPDTFDLPIYTLLCDTAPGGGAESDFVMMGTVPEGCEQYAGATVEIDSQDGTVYGSCETSAAEPCYVNVDVPEGVVATIDPATIPAGYALVDGQSQEIEIDPASEAWVAFVAVPAAETPTPSPTTEPLPPDRPVLIETGTCGDEPGGDVVADLRDLRAPDGEAAGQDGAITAETSTSTISYSIDELLASDHTVVVYADDDVDASGDPVACAPIGGVLNASDELVIGLDEQNGSMYTGVVYMAPSDADQTQTNVTVFLAHGLAEEDIEATPGV